jgi:hypothetical protein
MNYEKNAAKPKVEALRVGDGGDMTDIADQR